MRGGWNWHRIVSSGRLLYWRCWTLGFCYQCQLIMLLVDVLTSANDTHNSNLVANPSDRAAWGAYGLGPLEHWDHGFESHSGHEFTSEFLCVDLSCAVRGLAFGPSPVQVPPKYSKVSIVLKFIVNQKRPKGLPRHTYNKNGALAGVRLFRVWFIIMIVILLFHFCGEFSFSSF
jgi:hypothetical protein